MWRPGVPPRSVQRIVSDAGMDTNAQIVDMGGCGSCVAGTLQSRGGTMAEDTILFRRVIIKSNGDSSSCRKKSNQIHCMFHMNSKFDMNFFYFFSYIL